MEDKNDQTNYERVKKMSLEDMADYVDRKHFCGYENGIDCVFGWGGGDCKEHAKEWLERTTE